MRATAFVLLSALALTTIFTDYLPHNSAPALILTAHIDCSNYKNLPPVKERVCYAVYAPIHVSDGKTYSNDCYFCYEVKKVLK
ncbi:serine protease inhibitor Kazal-type 9-like [Eubalaena glacialis]|uniref:serine protease inhibitor Kazal-type 9-like n=1 Tax=Eubalaena glacialis TaxID=27606 RepID=UPI002A5AD691|nr:serine protease inhibitor Kazal-type 9-like [Eubalaena glacialis]